MGSGESKAESAVDAEEYVGALPVVRDEKKEDSSYLNEQLSDFQILVRNDSSTWRFPCHKLVLRKQRSLLADHCENLDSSEQMIITDIEPQIMELVLRYVYEKEILLDDWKMACEVLVAACQYEIKPLVEECEQFLLRSLTLRNVLFLLEKSKRFSLEKLNNECLELCKNAGFIVLRTKAFMSLTEDLIKDILEISGLNVRGEFFVFEALWDWSKMQCIHEGLPLTENDIGKRFCNVANLVKFECMTDHQKERLPKFVKQEYSEFLEKDKTSGTPSDLKENRFVKFPLNLNKDHYFSLLFEAKEKPINKDPVIGSFVCSLKFRVKLDAYVIGLTTLCVKNDSSLTSVKELKLSSPAGVLLSWEEGNEKYVKKIRTDSCAFSVADPTEVTETEFHATRLLPLYVGMTYTLEITPRKKEVEWPQTIPVVDKKKSDLEICLSARLCCGLKSIIFVQAK